jgi:protein tyrosine phosphatase (PTP) superfamily phosphohydrolase (DUF442 family)
LSGLTSWWSTASFRPFHRNKAACSTCGGGEGPVLEYGAPVVTPAPVAVPAPGVITPGPSSTVPPATGSGPSTLEPAPSAVPGPPAGDAGARNSTGKANYEAYRSNYRAARARQDSLARSDVPVLEPAPGPRASARGTTTASSNPLDNLPPVDIPSMDDSAEGRTSQSPPPAPAAVRETTPSAVPAPAETRSEAAGAASAPAPVSIAPGIKRFSVVDSKLAGGSLPSAAGLDWLVEKGYKTFLDLRDPAEVQPASISLVTAHGLRYVALPITDKTLDADHVARFNLELALADARPLYFCDTDGSRAGALWYIRRLTQDKIDPEVATREAEDLGLTDKALWQAASRYIETLKNDSPGGPQAAAPPAEPKAPAAEAGPDLSPADPAAAIPPAVAATSEGEGPAQDPTAWGSCAVLVVSGLSVPLAYWSASSLPSFRGLTRASLPAPGRRPKSLPSSSDA